MNTLSGTPRETPEADKTSRIRALNDAFRTTFVGGKVMITQGIQSLDTETIIRKVQVFDDFNTDNDPYGEHDFGSFMHDGQKIFWKIDYYDATLTFGSEDASDPDLTTRVLTMMLAEEY